MKNIPAKFIVLDDHYTQHYGYPLWCAHVLEKLRTNPPATAKDLIEQCAKYMHDKKNPAYREIFKQACAHEKIPPILSAHEERIFGPASHKKFGSPMRKHKETFATPIGRRGVGDWKEENFRGYLATLEKNHPEWLHQGPKNPLEFFYPIPGTTRSLELMKIGRDIDLYSGEDLERITPFPQERSKRSKIPHQIYFKHPSLQGTAYKDLISCLDPLHDIIFGEQSTKDEKVDSFITFYWLVAQTTPVYRGGSAHSRIILEYLASEAGLELPYVKKECDLWAEAASTDLGQFRASFKEGLFFDWHLTGKAILAWQSERLTHYNDLRR